MQETPLGQTVSIRAEKNTKKINKMTPHEKKIRQEWRKFQLQGFNSNGSKNAKLGDAGDLQKMFAAIFGKGVR